ncbi:craniofacial development protein 1-like [Styela clava]
MSDYDDKDSSSDVDDEDYIPDKLDADDDDDDYHVKVDSHDDSDHAVSKDEVDKIWNTFKADVSKIAPVHQGKDSNSVKSTQSIDNVQSSEVSEQKSTNGTTSLIGNDKTKETITVTKVYDFAGEDVKITKVVDKKSKEGQSHLKTRTMGASTSLPLTTKRKGGLQGILGKMEKRPKLSTLEKSKLDWQNYKDEEGIEDELKIYNKGKDGYVEKQLFLERTDFRQFEKERDIRLGKMSRR